MSVIWKEPLPLDEGRDRVTLESSGALHVGLDPNGVPCVWFWAPEADEGGRVPVIDVILVGTGIPLEAESVDRYIGTFVWRTLVLHAFEREHR